MSSLDELGALRRELAALEGGGSGGAEPLSVLGTSIEDLARMQERHSATLREFGRAVDAFGDPSMAPLPTPSAEPTLQRTHGAADLPPRPSTARGLSDSVPSAPLGVRPAFDRPLGSSGDRPLGSAPMHRTAGERREASEAASQRATAATEARYAQHAAQARARVEAAQARQAQRSAYLLERDGIDAERAAAALAAAAARVAAPVGGASGAASARAPARPSSDLYNHAAGGLSGSMSARAASSASASALGGGAAPVTAVRLPVERPRSAPKERPHVTVPVPFSFEHRPRRDTASERRLKLELEEERQALAIAQEHNKPRDLPPSTGALADGSNAPERPQAHAPHVLTLLCSAVPRPSARSSARALLGDGRRGRGGLARTTAAAADGAGALLLHAPPDALRKEGRGSRRWIEPHQPWPCAHQPCMRS
jgi:hypothetical protein